MMRILAWFLLPFCGAIALGCYMEPWWICWMLAPASLIACIAFSRKKGKQWSAATLAAAGALVGFLWFGIYTAVELGPIQPFVGKESAFSAVVTAYPRTYAGGVEVQIEVEQGMAEGHQALLFLKEPISALSPGDRVVGEGRYADARYMGGEKTSQCISREFFLTITGTVDSVVRGEHLPWTAIPPAVGRALTDRIGLLYPGDSGALLTGLITGNKSELSDPLYTAFQRSGMAHLLAVSGLHVGFLTGVLYVIPGSKRRRVLIAIPMLVFFALMTGEQASVWRAVIMAAILLSAPLFGRENDPVTSVSVALAVLLVQDPYACRGIGLQLSFAAVAGLACFQGKLYHWMTAPLSKTRSDNRCRRWLCKAWHMLAGALSTALAANVLTLPLCAYYFQSISLVGPISNLLSIWCASAAFVLGLLSCLISFLSMPLAQLLAGIVHGLLAWLMGVAEWLSRGAFSALALDNPYYMGWFVVTMCTLIAVVFVKGLRRRPLLPISASAGLLLLALSLRMITLSGSSFSVTALDVGKGSCTVLGAQGTYAAVDCQGQDAGNRLADYLSSAGTKKLSLLVLERLDAGRKESVEQLLARIEVERVAIPAWETGSWSELEWSELLLDNGCEVILLDKEMEANFGEVTLSILPVLEYDGQNRTVLAAPVLCSWKDHHVLVSGGLDGAQIPSLMERWNLPKLDALLASNGRAADASDLALLAETRPDCAILSAGGAPFDEVNEDVLRRLGSFGTVIYTTDRNGTVTLRY